LLNKLREDSGFLPERSVSVRLNRKIEDLLKVLIEVRAKLRQEKKWDLADEIRKKLEDIGIQLEDKKEETKWRIKAVISNV